MPTGNTATIQAGPGQLYIAAIGTAEPTLLSAALPSQWTSLGYTEEGTQFTHDINMEGITPAEELEPVIYKDTGRTITVEFALMEITAKNLQRSLNGGTISAPSGAAVTFEPPALGASTPVMLIWDAQDVDGTTGTQTERWLFRRARQTGSVQINRRKGATNASIPATFTLEKPSGANPYKVWFADPLRTGS